MNGYTVKKSTIVVNNRKKAVLEAWKDGEEKICSDLK